tara:strand:- start:705 stop:1031 length:327 start_codon:yes stop_codon:yes gene_type:complete
MIYELRVYECYAGKLPELHERFANHTMKLFEKYGIQSVGYWVTDVGPSNQTLTYLLAFKDANHRVEAWSKFRVDPEWLRVVEESHKDGILVKNFSNQTLIPTPYSPLQ